MTRYVGSAYYHTGATDSPANTTYEGNLTGSPSFASRMSEAFSGRSFVAFGVLTFDNSDGDLDGWIDDSFAGREVLVKLGDPSWDIADFRTVISGISDRLIISSDSALELIIRDKQRLLDRPIQDSLIASGENEGNVLPLCYGQVKNIAPVLIDDTTHEYQVHEGSIEAISAVYENGVATSLTVKNDLSNGKFTLSAKPEGALTCDVQGDNSGGYTADLADIVERLVTREIASVDATAKAAFASAVSYDCGLYISERANLLDVLDSLLFGWFYGFNRDGEFIMSVLAEPTGSIADIDSLETYGSIEVTKADVPSWRQRIGYNRNWTVMDDPDETVAEAHRAYLASEFANVAKYEDATVQTEHLTAQDPDVKGSILCLEADGITEATRLQGLYGSQRFMYRVQAFTAPYQITIGDTVTLSDHRYGLSAGVDCVVIGITELLLDNKIELELWR
ncbi:MAG: hypothetical protein GY759_08400 [Chloroflexi bacterium]|nr:hypothetical protein [Chloroflexota bacterium]